MGQQDLKIGKYLLKTEDLGFQLTVSNATISALSRV